MKKTYLSPEADLLLMATEDLLGASQNPEGFSEELDNSKTITPEEMLSRRRSVWDDEDVLEEE